MNKTRLEAFSDGVIAIVITIMVFEIELPELAAGFTGRDAWNVLAALLPKIATYSLSFVVLAIMWLNHHALFDQVGQTNSRLVWLNSHLLFWMSLIPLPTAFLAAHPWLPQACLFYGIVLGGCISAFSLLRWYASVRAKLMPFHPRFHRSNIAASVLYFSAAPLAFVSPAISYLIFMVIPVWYFLPDKLANASEGR